MTENKAERVRTIHWSWRNYARKPWPVVKYTRHMKWVEGCSSLLVGPFEFIWATR
jgi:hypothetical protein